MTGRLALTWWGHSSTTVELDGVRIATDPLLTNRLAHLRRSGPMPGSRAADADLILISHLHGDHLHVPSLRRFRSGAPVLAPPGAAAIIGRGATGPIYEMRPGEERNLCGLRIQVTAAFHDGRRSPLSRKGSPALGFRVSGVAHSVWYPGDTGLTEAMSQLASVDLALVPIGGWGPSLGEHHLDPVQAAEALRRVGATFAVPVHYGTFWPVGLRRLSPASHERLFVAPPTHFVAAAAHQTPATRVHVARQGQRIELIADEQAER
ncbi:MBL fold metallo-hydrolase [Leekyejoonella antrihumi]|uniref:MBL fold metallo-hydrolase n=1 Tax=Leekyejoonella antrihumi TaxID=1660198 RepID=A0A563E101_9MICO|nr:MBL fold metallo-hydrolase [Leekyejoonella antrihumi]TWP35574.1 MBL fold metallo-hydrolase [Leekyejoonella antrihumi]